MSSFYTDIRGKILNELRKESSNSFSSIKESTITDFEEVAQDAARIIELYTTGNASKEFLKDQFNVLRVRIIAILATIEILSQSALERVLNGVLTVIRDTINTKIGFQLI